MATAGFVGPFTNYFSTGGTGVSNQHATRIVMPQAGLITSVEAYFAAWYGTCRARLCVWRADGTLLAQSAELIVAAGTQAVDGQRWNAASLLAGYQAALNQEIWAGWWRHPDDSHTWSHHASSGSRVIQTTNVAQPSALAVGSVSGGSFGTRITYTPGTGGGSGTPRRARVLQASGGWGRYPVKILGEDGAWREEELKVTV